MDSSPLPFSGGAAEDDGSMSVAAGLAKEAALLFQAGKFAECLKTLNQLVQKKADDPKVLHNTAIAETLQDGCSDPKRFITALENVKKQSEDLALVSGVPIEVSKNNSNSTVGTRGNNNGPHQFPSSSDIDNDEFDTTVAMFNIAVVWFHLHEYGKSFSYLDTLYQDIEPIDEGTALRICLLLLDVALLSQHASRSADVISYMEKVFCANTSSNQVDNGTSVQQHLLSVPKPGSLPSNSTIHDASHSDSIGTANTLENLEEEPLEEESLQLLSSLNISGQSLRRPPGIASSNDLARSHSEDSVSASDLRLKLHLYKVRFFLLIRNLKAAKREVKLAMNTARGKDYPMALYLKSQLEYARGNHRKAIKLLEASSNHPETGISSMYYNNLGCIYYRLGKHHTSGVFFSKAMSNSSFVRKEKPPKLLTFLQDKSLHITYNCGVHSLACGRPFHAARCFQMASLIFYNRPLLWLRIAECCLMALEKGLIDCISTASDRSDIRAHVIGNGKWRQLALKHGCLPDSMSRCGGNGDSFPAEDKQPGLSMPLAQMCLINVLYLLGSSEAKPSRSGSPPNSQESDSSETLPSQNTNHKNVTGGDTKPVNVSSASSQVNSNGEVREKKGGNSQISSLQNSFPHYEQVRMKENWMIKQAALADLAYVELALGNPLKALSTARTLLTLLDCSRIYIFLGTMYAAEALCLLNRPREAAEHLMRYISSGNNVELPYTKGDCEKWTAEKILDNEEPNGGTIPTNGFSSSNESQVSVALSPEQARGIFCANYAANFALLGNLDQADYFAKKALSDIPNSSQAVLTAIYVDLKRGKTQEVITKLKQHRGVRFLPVSSALKGSS